MDCSRRSVIDSSHAYDQRLLSIIGKSPSPRQSVNFGSDNQSNPPPPPPSSSSSLLHPSRTSNLPSSPGAPDSSHLLDARWYGSPQSDRLSPGVTKQGWRDHMDCQSPGGESSAPSSAVDYDPYRRPVAGMITPQHEESSSLPSRSNRGSYDHSIFSDADGDIVTDDSSGLAFRLREATPPYLDPARPGMKRRASSPPRDLPSRDRLTIHTNTSAGDLSHRRSGPPYFTNTLPVNGGYASNRGSLSASSSSSLRTRGSFSSAPLSLGTSMTSLSSYDRPSPGGISPTADVDPVPDKSLLNPNSAAGTMPGPSTVRSAPASDSLDPKTANSARKLPMQSTLRAAKAAGSKIGGLYICDCCLKKPKKFDTLEDLR